MFWFTLLGAAVGAVYSQVTGVMHGSPPLSLGSAPRGALTGAAIAIVIISFELFILAEPLGARLRQAPFAVHVVAKTFLYLAIILVALTLGDWAYATRDHGIQPLDVLFSLIASSFSSSCST